jgi:hypothetical protein
MRTIFRSVVFLLASFAAGTLVPCLAQSKPPTSGIPIVRKVRRMGPNDTPESVLGERLFLETRFAQYFAAHSNGEVNRPLPQGDPVVAQVRNPRAGVPYPSPFAGKSMNCRSCHFVDEFTSLIAGMNRTYADYLPRTPIPERGDGQTVTVRNARNMVDEFTPRHSKILLHGDGEFLTVEELVKSTLSGRDFGWLPTEYDEAIKNVAKVIREDDGRDDLGQQYGGSYAKLMLGTASDIPDQFRLAKEYRLDVKSASNQQIADDVARLTSAYLKSLRFEQTRDGIHTGSAYDMFLAKNDLPAMPNQGESDVEYSQRLLLELDRLQNPRFVLPYERWLRFHPHLLEFRQQELDGLKIFLRQSAPPAQTLTARRVSPFFLLAGLPLFGVLLGRTKRMSDWVIAAVLSLLICAATAAAMNSPSADRTQVAPSPVSHTGNCVRCHAAPDFTDDGFHNTGAAQEEYDSVHGAGSFARLAVPSYAERSRDLDRYIPATTSHPHATSVFRSVPSADNPLATDLGMWNIFANPDYPEVQNRMRVLLCGSGPCYPEVQLPRTIACFRTPSLRDLGHSWPYLHTGRMATVEDMLHFYVRMSELARAGKLRNGAPELSGISLDEKDIAALAAFLRSLDEDYDN